MVHNTLLRSAAPLRAQSHQFKFFSKAQYLQATNVLKTLRSDRVKGKTSAELLESKSRNLSGHDGVVGADRDEDHVVDLREQEGAVVDVALQDHLKQDGKDFLQYLLKTQGHV